MTFIAKMAAILSLNHSQFSSGLRQAGQETIGFQQKVSKSTAGTKSFADGLNRVSVSAAGLGSALGRKLIGPLALLIAAGNSLEAIAKTIDDLRGLSFRQLPQAAGTSLKDRSVELFDFSRRIWVVGGILKTIDSTLIAIVPSIRRYVEATQRMSEAAASQAAIGEALKKSAELTKSQRNDVLGVLPSEKLKATLDVIGQLRAVGKLSDSELRFALESARQEAIGRVTGRQMVPSQITVGGAPNSTSNRLDVRVVDPELKSVLKRIEMILSGGVPARAN